MAKENIEKISENLEALKRRINKNIFNGNDEVFVNMYKDVRSGRFVCQKFRENIDIKPEMQLDGMVLETVQVKFSQEDFNNIPDINYIRSIYSKRPDGRNVILDHYGLRNDYDRKSLTEISFSSNKSVEEVEKLDEYGLKQIEYDMTLFMACSQKNNIKTYAK